MERKTALVLLKIGGVMAEVERWLAKAGLDPLVVGEAGEPLVEALAGGDATLLVPLDQLEAANRTLSQPSLSGSRRPSVLVICPPGSSRPMDAVRASVDDALAWPLGKAYLAERIEALENRRAVVQELRRRRFLSRQLRRATAQLADEETLQETLHELLNLAVEWTDARRAMILALVKQEDFIYIMGDSSDSLAVWLPVPASRFPEVRQVAEAQQEELLRCSDAGADPRQLALMQERQVAQTVVLPLIWGERGYGVLEVWFDEEDHLDEPGLDALRTLAAVLSPVLHESEMFRFKDEQTNITAVAFPDDDPGLPVLEKYKEFFQQAVDGIVVLDGEGQIVHINAAGEQLTGYSRVGLVGTPMADLVVEQQRGRLARVLEELGRSGKPQTFDLDLVTTSQDTITVQVSTNAVLEANAVVVLSFRDVSEARGLARELSATNEFLNRLINSTAEAIIVTDPEGLVVRFNRAAERIFGLAAGDVLGKQTLSDLLPGSEIGDLLQELGESDAEPDPVRTDVLNVERGRTPVMLTAHRLHGRGQGAVFLANDLTEHHRMERRLAQTEEKLEATEKQALIAELAGTTAHELNQPLTSVMGYAELLKRQLPQEEKYLHSVNTIISEADRMAEIVRKIGRITRYETKNYVGKAQILDLEKSSS